MWTENFSNVVLDHGCKQYAAGEPYVRTHTHMHRKNSHLNTLVWGSLTLVQLVYIGLQVGYPCSIKWKNSKQGAIRLV